MKVIRCQVKLSKVVQVDIPESVIGGQSIGALAKLTAREQYGYDHDAEVLQTETAYVGDTPNKSVHPTLRESAECECGGKYYHANCKLVYRSPQSG